MESNLLTLFRVKLELKDVEIDHLSTFLVDRARLSLIGPTIAVNITVPTIYTHGDYNLSGILGNMFPLKGSGPFQVVIYGFKAYVHTVLGYSRGMYMKSFELDFSLEAIDLALENLMGDEKVSKVMNEARQINFIHFIIHYIINFINKKINSSKN